MLKMTRAVARNRTRVIRTGIIVHASSTCRLPTTTKMQAVIPITNSDSSKMDWAGVEAGAKMSVDAEVRCNSSEIAIIGMCILIAPRGCRADCALLNRIARGVPAALQSRCELTVAH